MESVSQPKPLLKPWLTTALLVVLFVAGLGIRLYDLTDLPNDFYMVRQYHSLVIARGMYYAHLTAVLEWQRTMAVAQWKAEGLIEPPIMESIVALTYNLTGVRTWMGRFYASLFWLIGGFAIWLLAKEMSMRYGGFLALAYFLFVPFAVTVSLVAMGAVSRGEAPYLETGHPGWRIDRVDHLCQIGGGISHAGRSGRLGDQPGLLETHFRR